MPDQSPAHRRRLLNWRGVVSQLPLLATLATVVISGYNVLQSQNQYAKSEASTQFSSAITLLSNGNFNARLGGVFVLGNLARTTSDEAFAASQVLAAYLRGQHTASAASRAAAYTPGNAAEDVQAALVSIVNRSQQDRPLSLAAVSARNAYLTGYTIQGLNFRSADLTGLNVEGSTLRDVQFTGSTLAHANFKNAVLSEVDFSQADVTGADFSGADLRGATHLSAATLAKATLSSSTRRPTAATSDSGDSAP